MSQPRSEHPNTRHGHWVNGKPSPTWLSWRAMRSRCLCTSNIAYGRYGGAGITVCPAWDSFDRFLTDMGERSEGTTLDRIDSSKGYGPDNCRWATATEQNRNKQTLLDMSKAHQIRWLSEMDYSYSRIGRMYGVSQSLVHAVVTNKLWIQKKS